MLMVGLVMDHAEVIAIHQGATGWVDLPLDLPSGYRFDAMTTAKTEGRNISDSTEATRMEGHVEKIIL
jgi:hypothetical protein